MQGRDYHLKIEGQAEIDNFVSESIGDFAIKDDRYGATDCVCYKNVVSRRCNGVK